MHPEPKVAIGIPTFNRAYLLKEAIVSVLSQSYQNIEIIISDNNSTDNTEEVVKELQDRSGNVIIQYHKHDTAIPVVENWLSTLEKADSVYFGWLQDDDIIAPDFVKTAVDSLETVDEATVYCSYAQYAKKSEISGNMAIWGNPFQLNWIKGEKKVLSGHTVIPLSVFDVLGYSPVAMFDRKRLKDSSKYITKDYWLFSERMVMIQASLGNKLIFDSKIGGLYRSHSEQRSFINSQKKELERQKIIFLDDLNKIYLDIGEAVFEKFEQHLGEIELSKKVKWRINSIKIRNANALCEKAFSILNENLKKEKKSNPTYFLKLRIEKIKKLLKAPYHYAVSTYIRIKK